MVELLKGTGKFGWEPASTSIDAIHKLGEVNDDKTTNKEVF